MIFKTYVFEMSESKEKAEFVETLLIIGLIFVLILIYVLLFSGLFPLIMLGAVAFGVLSIKIRSNKKKGVNRVGSLTFKMSISPELLIIGSNEFRIKELTNLDITAKDYIGRTSDLFKTEYGVDNHIKFVSEGREYSYQFQIKLKKDIALTNEMLLTAKDSNA